MAGEAIRGELGLSATEFGVLLSAFSLSYGFSQLPSGILLDRFGPRIVLGAGLIFWSLMQALTGMVNSFSHFILMRIGLGIGEAPFMPAGVKSITDWYAQKERGTALGIFNSSTVIGQAIAPPALVLMQLAWGWRAMFVIIGVAGILMIIYDCSFYHSFFVFVLPCFPTSCEVGKQMANLFADFYRFLPISYFPSFHLKYRKSFYIGGGRVFKDNPLHLKSDPFGIAV